MQVPKDVMFLLNRLTAYGFEAYAVGGCVRDTLLGRTPRDWDITTSAKPLQVIDAFPDLHVIETGLQHGTVTVRIHHVSYEVTTYRVEGEYLDHRRPESVTFVSDLALDLARRDFTINAMAYHPKHGLVDPFGGKKDLEASLIRAVGDAKLRFSEDALRIMRGIRFAAAYEFKIEEETARAMRDCAPLLNCIARERIMVEFRKFLVTNAPSCYLREFRDVFQVFLPGEICIDGLDKLEKTLILRLAYLCRHCENVLKELRFERKIIDAVRAIIGCKHTDLRHILGSLGAENAKRYVAYQRALGTYLDEEALLKLIHEGACCKIQDLAINGRDVIELGIPAGAQVGRILKELLKRVMNGEIPNEPDALRRAAENLDRLTE